MSWAARRTAVLVLLAVFLVGGAVGWVAEEVADDLHWQARHDQGETPDRAESEQALAALSALFQPRPGATE